MASLLDGCRSTATDDDAFWGREDRDPLSLPRRRVVARLSLALIAESRSASPPVIWSRTSAAPLQGRSGGLEFGVTVEAII